MQIRIASVIVCLSMCSSLNAQLSFRQSDFTLSSEGQELRLAFSGGMHSGQFFLMDLNEDGLDDLLVFDRAGDILKTFIWQDDRFVWAPDYAQYFPADLQNWWYLADYNCDGAKDIFTYSSFGVRVFTNQSLPGELPAWQLTHDPLFTLSGTSTVNLLVNPSDMPVISDVDQDGDLDILAFNFASGETMSFFQNLSSETGDGCGLSFSRTNQRWGDFSECGCGYYEFGDAVCTASSGRTMHIGGKAVLLTDLNNDAVPELLIGEENCDEITVLSGSEANSELAFNSFDFLFPEDLRPYAGQFFPAAYGGDFDKNGVQDLVISSNHREDLLGLDFSNSVFLLPDAAATNPAGPPIPFLQNEMFDRGENAVPVVFDANGDGRPDLLVANKGLPDGVDFNATVSLLLNTGDGHFEFSESDWMNLSTLQLTNLSLQMTDINRDGQKDLVIKSFGLNTFGLQLLWIPNRDLQFDPAEASGLDLAINATDNPFFFDVNSDGKLDVLLGQSNGRLSLWLNSGTNEMPVYPSKTDAYLGVNLNPARTFLVPLVVDADRNNIPDLLLADNSGALRLIYDFVGNAPRTTEVLAYNDLLDDVHPLKAGRRIWPALADLNGDNALELVIGTAQGGLLLFSEVESSGLPPAGLKLQVRMYPNPLMSGEELKLRSNLDATMELLNVSGQSLQPAVMLRRNETVQLNLNNLPTGLYFVRIQAGEQIISRRLIIGI